MPRRQLHLATHAERLQAALDALHAELKVPAEFPAEVRAEADEVASSGPAPERDLTDVPFVTIDPPRAIDLDAFLNQAATLSFEGPATTRSMALFRPTRGTRRSQPSTQMPQRRYGDWSTATGWRSVLRWPAGPRCRTGSGAGCPACPR